MKGAADRLIFDRVGKSYGKTRVLDGVSFEVEPGELIVLVGPSGCGKSTLLRMIAGLESVSDGTITLGGRALNDVPPHARGVGMVFQSYALYPHMTVRENLAFPLTVRKAAATEIARAVGEVAELLSLVPLLDRLPKELSGGQRQRIAIGRCLVRKPEIYCFDEPLSNLDAGLRTQIRVELRSIQRKLGKTAIYVTHDQVEAMTLADRMVILDKGRVEQMGPPMEVYDRPESTFVARFVGQPPSAILRATARGGAITIAGVPVGRAEVSDGPILVAVRPEDVVLGPGPLESTVVAIEPTGEHTYVHLAIDEGTPSEQRLVATLRERDDTRVTMGARLTADLRHARLGLFDATTEKRLPHALEAPRP